MWEPRIYILLTTIADPPPLPDSPGLENRRRAPARLGATPRIVLATGCAYHGRQRARSTSPDSIDVSVPHTHRVITCLGGDRTALEERALEEPREGELLLRVRVAGLCGTDLFKLDSGALTPGTVLGHELVGEVVAAGAGLGEFGRGDRIAVPHHVACGTCVLCRRGADTMCEVFKENLLAPGGFADHVLVKGRAVARAARKLPDGLADEVAVFMEPAACVLRGVRRAGLDSGAIAVVQGGGGMGLLHLLVLKAVYRRLRTLVVDPIEARRRFAAELGADEVAGPGEDAARRLEEMTDGYGADAVFDTVGGAEALASALAHARSGGTVVLFAHARAGERAGFELNDLFKREHRVLGSYSGGLDDQARVFQMMVDGVLDPSPLVSHRLPLEAFAQGVEIARRRESLKILFTP